ncbi:MAG: NAD(P)H-dependent oxidoreductase [Chloroflexi bacterium]|nr:NAD(P)H-dependent oxidoreductase [Chloroflexota bacterium]
MEQWRAVTVLICFYSRYGSTARLAEAVAEGARVSPGDEVWLRRAPELEPVEIIRQDDRRWRTFQDLAGRFPEPRPEELERADALVLGSPGYFGMIASPLKHWLETVLGRFWQGQEIGEKAGAAFCTTSTVHGGNEVTILSMLVSLMHLGCVIVPSGYLSPPLRRNQMPYGASAVTGVADEILPTEDDLAAARALGYRVAHVARWLLAGRGQEEFRRRYPAWAPPAAGGRVGDLAPGISPRGPEDKEQPHP